ncbi:MAG: hypothetical protein K0R57_3790 [Paenibacillaceae bacterium]|jgi:competence protein ComQ|nr:hypothetical protein [Paenibacillaceae bacterium]
MNEALIDDMSRLIDDYFTEPDLNRYLKVFLREKQEEGTRWAEITRCTHHVLGGNSPLIDKNAALTEMMILAIDIVDDIQDQDNHSKPWMLCPIGHALNAVCSFLVAFIAEVPAATAQSAGRLLALSVNGQQKDLNGSIATEADYMEMIHKKSGSLLRFACQMGMSLVPELPKDIAAQLDELAECIGVAAQLDNDLKDLSKMESKSDLMCKKRTLPILFMLRDGLAEFPYINQYYDGELTAEQFFSRKAELLEYVEASGCIEYTRIVQSLYIERAEELLDALPFSSEGKQQFKNITFGAQNIA